MLIWRLPFYARTEVGIMEPEMLLALAPALYAVGFALWQSAKVREELRRKTDSEDKLLNILSWPARRLLGLF